MKNTYFICFLLVTIMIACTENTAEDSKINVLEEPVANEKPTTNHAITNDSETAKVEVSKEALPKQEVKEMEQKPKQKLVISDALVQQKSPFDTDYLMGKFDPNTHPDFSKIDTKYASKSGMRMRTDAYGQFIKMYDAAKIEGINLKIISATRPFHHQKSIWEAKWNGQRQVDGKILPSNMEPKQKAMRILRWSSMPGTSRHHWGTDIDLNDLNNAYFEKGQGEKIYEWLTANASAYGFCQVYSPKGSDRPDGYEEEKWHWSYLPVARQLTNLYKEKLSNGDIEGFTGSESAELIDIKTKYVLGINPNCE